jgi:hypothetical protein
MVASHGKEVILHNTDHKVAEGIYVQELLQDGEASFLLQRAVAPQ